MSFKCLKQLFLGFIIVASANTTAGIISSSDTHTTADGSVVNLSGLDWLSWDVTSGQSRTSIEGGFNGLLDDGWRYATVTEYKTLMESVFDYHSGWHVDNSDGTQWLLNNFIGDTSGWDLYTSEIYRFFGTSTECASDSTTSCLAIDGNQYGSTSGWLGTNAGVYYAQDSRGSTIKSKDWSRSTSSVLVRSTHIPEPSTLAIFALGLIGLVSRRFKKQP